MNCGYESQQAEARASLAEKSTATRATVSSELKRVGGGTCGTCSKCEKRRMSKSSQSPVRARKGVPRAGDEQISSMSCGCPDKSSQSPVRARKGVPRAGDEHGSSMSCGRPDKSSQSPVRARKGVPRAGDEHVSSMACGCPDISAPCSSAAAPILSALKKSDSFASIGPVLGRRQRSLRQKSTRIADMEEDCSDTADSQLKGGERSCSMSLPIGSRVDRETDSSAKKDMLQSMKDTPKSTTDTPRTITDAALLKSRLLLQQLEQLGLSEDVECDNDDQAPARDWSPVSKMSTSTSVSFFPNGAESAVTDGVGVETVDIAHMPAKCLEMIQGMQEELQRFQGMQEELLRLHSRESPPADIGKQADMVSVPSSLLEMMAHMYKEIEDLRSCKSPTDHTKLATCPTQSAASISSRSTTADGTASDMLSVFDFLPASPPPTSPTRTSFVREADASQAEICSIASAILSHSQPPLLDSGRCTRKSLLLQTAEVPLFLGTDNYPRATSIRHAMEAIASPPLLSRQDSAGFVSLSSEQIAANPGLQSSRPTLRSPIKERSAVTQSPLRSPIKQRPVRTQSPLRSPIRQRPVLTQSPLRSRITEQPSVTQLPLQSSVTQSPSLMHRSIPVGLSSHSQHTPFSYLKRTVSIQDTIVTVL